MSQYSASQKQFVQEALKSGLRIDGRVANQRRIARLESSILDNLAGSSHLCIDYDRCEIYTGVKLKLSSSNEEQSATKVFLELSSMRVLSKEEGQIVTYLQELLQQHFISREKNSFSKIVIPNSKKHYLEIHIEVFILTQPHISLLEPLYLSVRKALLSTVIPKTQSFFNEVTNEQTVQLTSQSQELRLQGIDNLMVIGWHEGKGLLDLTPLQFEAIDGAWVVIIRGEKVIGLQTLKGSIASEDIHRVCKFALQNRK